MSDNTKTSRTVVFACLGVLLAATAMAQSPPSHRMSGFEAMPAMMESEQQKQMDEMRKQMDEMMGLRR